MQAKDVLIPCRRETLLDDLGTKWSNLMLMSYLADGVRELLARRPDFLLAEDGSLNANDVYDANGDTPHVRIRLGRLEIWDTTLTQWIAVEMQDGALVSIDQSSSTDGPSWALDDVLTSMEADIGVSDQAMRYPLQEYVTYRALVSYAESADAKARAEEHYQGFRRRIGA